MLRPTANRQSGVVSIYKKSQAGKRVGITVLIGIGLFSLLYVIAAINYPGGSTADSTTPDFNLLTNYWCDLLGSNAKNGQPNPAQPIAFVAMSVLCLTLGYFWYVTPALFGFSKVKKRGLQIAGVLSMSIAPFIFTHYHDTVINIAGLLGVCALVGTLIGLYKSLKNRLFGFGIFCLFLSGVNYFIYQTLWFIDYLPVIQKITFFLFLVWFSLVGLTLRRNVIAHE